MKKEKQRKGHKSQEISSGETANIKRIVSKPRLSVSELGIIDNLYESVIHNALDAFFITNFQGEILEVNDALCRMEGYSRNELLSMRLHDFDIEIKKAPQEFEKFQQKFLQDFISSNGRKNSIYVERKHRRKDGCIIDVAISYHYLGPDLDLFFHFNRDVTERRQAEEKLRESKEFIENVIASMRDGFVIMDDKGVFIEVNKAFCQMTGFTRAELIGKGPPQPYWPEEEYEEIQKSFKKTLRGDFDDRELVFKRKNGERFPVIVSPSCLKDNDGNIISIFSSIKDITEHKGLVTERILRQETEEQLKQRKEFTRALAHELKTPLTPLLATSEILLSEAHEEPILSYAKNINAGAHELNRRIGDLLYLARGEVGMIELKFKRVDLLPVIKSAVDYVMPEASRSDLSLKMDIDSSLPRVLADKQRIRQVVLNLLDNSIKYTRRGGSVSVHASKEGGFVVITVTDTGCGIAKKDRESIFKPYTHLSGKGNNYRGLGLGLALSKVFVELHGGSIWLESKDRQGSSFSFTLPIYKRGKQSERKKK